MDSVEEGGEADACCCDDRYGWDGNHQREKDLSSFCERMVGIFTKKREGGETQRHGGNLWSGGLGPGAYLRIKLSETGAARACVGGQTDRSRHLSTALEYLLCSHETPSEESQTPRQLQPQQPQQRQQQQQKQGQQANCEEADHHTSLLSNARVGSGCLLAAVYARLGRAREAGETASAVLGILEDLYDAKEISKYYTSGNRMAPSRHDCSILFGLAGALQAIWFLRRELRDESLGRDLALTLSYTILLEGLQHEGKHGNNENNENSDRVRLLWEWNRWPYLGAGTGTVGILYALLGHTDDEWEDLGDCLPRAKAVVRATIDGLFDRRYERGTTLAALSPEPSDSLLRLRSGRGNLRDALVGFEPCEARSVADWTHGAPGYCLLLLKAFDVFGDEKYFYHALDLCESVLWPRQRKPSSQQHATGKPHKKGGACGLAKGTTGIAYVFLAMGRVDTRNRGIWVSRARELAVRLCREHGEDENENAVGLEAAHRQHPSSALSLFDGLGGLASLLIDLEALEEERNSSCVAGENSFTNGPPRPSHVPCFPLFESCQANPRPRKLEYKTRPEDHFGGVVAAAGSPPSSPRKEHKPTTNEAATGGSTAGTVTTGAPTASVVTPTHHQDRPTHPVVSVDHQKSAFASSGPMAVVLDVSQLTEPSLLPAKEDTATETTTTPQGVASRRRRSNSAAPVASPAIPKTPAEATIETRGSFPPSGEKQRRRSSQKPSPRRLETRPSPLSPNREKQRRRSSQNAKSKPSPEGRPSRGTDPGQPPFPGANESSKKNNAKNLNTNSSNKSDAFMTDSIDRQQRAEASWVKHFGTSHQREVFRHRHHRKRGGQAAAATTSGRAVAASPPIGSSFRRMVGGFSGLPGSRD